MPSYRFREHVSYPLPLQLIMSLETITVNSCFRDQPVVVKITDSTLAEDVIIEVCKQLKISPVSRPLFALKNCGLSRNAWLSLSHRIRDDKIKTNYEFAIRFKVSDTKRLKEDDAVAFECYFRQARDSILHNNVPAPTMEVREYVSHLIGLGVTDMIRATLEEGLTQKEVIKNYRRYVPLLVTKRHRLFLKKPVIQAFEDVKLRNCDPPYLKNAYLEVFKVIFPDYMVEEFNALLLRSEADRPYSAVIRVNPFDTERPGISVKEEHKDWEHICSIEDLCYVNTRQTGMVEVSRKNGISIFFKFEIITDMKSFATLLDGYYRLMCKWTFNLCRDLPTPSLQRLFSLKCHGPVSGEFAYRKLEEKKNIDVGRYILRESILDYDSYYMDVCTELSKTPITYKIVKTNDDRYQIQGEQNSFPTIPDLIKDFRTRTENQPGLLCVPPTEYDISNLLLCRVEDEKSKAKKDDPSEIPSSSPICIDAKTLMVFKNLPDPGRSSSTIVFPGLWNIGNGVKKNVCLKVLEKTFEQDYLSEFLTLTSRWAFVNSSSLVKLYGITLSSPVAMVMEQLPAGRLDLFLSQNPTIPEVNLVEAVTYLANALYYLAEAKFVHGYLRCRKLLVADHSPNSFVVKLADPGLCNPYSDFDLHWIPPEYHKEPNAARSSMRSDVWAYATTLWEIFSYGVVPAEHHAEAITKFYADPRNHLPKPRACPKLVYLLMLECWSFDPYTRKTPQTIMRDINQIFYEVYNSKLFNLYTAILPTFKESEPDSVSNNSKTSNDYSMSVLSELTLNTLLDEGEENSSMESMMRNMNVNAGDYQATTDNHYGKYLCITDREEMIALSKHANESYKMNEESISTMQSIFELDKEWNLVLKGLIGEGYHGQVFRGELHHHYEEKEPQRVAVKKLKRDAMNRNNILDMDHELKTMLKLDHPNIVKVIGRVQEPDLCLVLEYVEQGSLKSYLNIHKEWLDMFQLLKFALDIANGMSYLNDMKFVHRDLAARNILVSGCCGKISDFGLARFIGDDSYYYYRDSNRDLPVKWYAPESIEENKFSFQSDVWSYGVTLYEMFTYGADPALPNVGQKAQEICAALKSNIRLPMPHDCPQMIYTKIMAPCWKYDAHMRPTFKELCRSIEDFFAKTQSNTIS